MHNVTKIDEKCAISSLRTRQGEAIQLLCITGLLLRFAHRNDDGAGVLLDCFLLRSSQSQ